MRSVFAILVVAAACTAPATSVAPPQFRPYYPTGMALSPDEKFLFYVNANSDLQYDSGTLQTIDLDAVSNLSLVSGCSPDPTQPSVLVCPSVDANDKPTSYMVTGGTVRIGNFAVAVGVQTLTSGKLRLFTTVRGDPSLTWMDFDESTKTLDCGATGSFPICSDAHRLNETHGNPSLDFLLPEPFYLVVDGAAQHVFMTHLTSGEVTLAHAPLDGSPPTLEDAIFGIFAPNSATGLEGTVGIAARKPGDPNGYVYVTSKEEARVALVRAQAEAAGADGLPNEKLVRGPSFFFNGYNDVNAAGVLGDSRGIVFGPDGDRAYIISRLPPSLVVYDTSIGSDGLPVNRVLGQVEVCAQPSDVQVADVGAGLEAFVPCFSTGQLWIINLETLELESTLAVGPGPNQVVVSPTRKLAFVTNYAADTISVVDVNPASPTRDQLILRLGKERP